MSMIWSSKSVLPSQNFDTHLFHVLRKSGCSWFSWLVMIFILLGPRPLGPMGPSMFCDFSKIQFMVWDLSKSVPKVFRSPRNPLIHLFYLIFNQKCHFSKCHSFIELSIVLPIVFPIELLISCRIAYLIAYWLRCGTIIGYANGWLPSTPPSANWATRRCMAGCGPRKSAGRASEKANRPELCEIIRNYVKKQ